MFTISDIYKDDLPDDSIFVIEVPSSYKPHFGNPAYLVNSTRYLADDEYRAHDYASNRIDRPHRILPILGSRVRAYVAERPATALVEHWQRRLGTKPPRYAELGEPVPHVCMFPLEVLAPELHAVDPEVHYHIHSKAFIPEIDCSQPVVYNQRQCPSVLKACRSAGGAGTWMIHTDEEYDYWIAEIRATMPYAETILTEMVMDVKHNMYCHMYVSRKGDMKWLAVTEQLLNDNQTWMGAVMQMSYQDEWERLLRRTAEPVSTALHSRGFFGLFGIDVLVDSAGRQYVVDINPRVVASTALVFTSFTLQMLGRSHEVAIFLIRKLVKAASPQVLVERAEAVVDGELIVYSIVDTGDGVYRCQIGVFASSITKCRAIAADFC